MGPPIMMISITNTPAVIPKASPAMRPTTSDAQMLTRTPTAFAPVTCSERFFPIGEPDPGQASAPGDTLRLQLGQQINVAGGDSDCWSDVAIPQAAQNFAAGDNFAPHCGQ